MQDLLSASGMTPAASGDRGLGLRDFLRWAYVIMPEHIHVMVWHESVVVFNIVVDQRGLVFDPGPLTFVSFPF